LDICQGVFINPALVEPFGLTLIEVGFDSCFFHYLPSFTCGNEIDQFMFELMQAAAHGLPMVATKNGGPVDIHRVKDGLHLFHLNGPNFFF